MRELLAQPVIILLAIGMAFFGIYLLYMFAVIAFNVLPRVSRVEGRATATPPPPALLPLTALLTEAGYHWVGTHTVKTLWGDQTKTHWWYVQRDRTVFADVSVADGQPSLSLLTRFNSDQFAITTYPLGSTVTTPMLYARYAGSDPVAALRHHTKLSKLGTPVVVHSLQTLHDWYREHIRRGDRARLLERQGLLLLLAGVITLLGALSGIATVIGFFQTGEVSLIGSFGQLIPLCLPLIGKHVNRWVQRPPGALDAAASRQEARQRALTGQPTTVTYSFWRSLVPKPWVFLLVGLVLIPLVIVMFADSVLALTQLATLRTQRDGTWIDMPLPGGQLRELAAHPDGSLWGVTSYGLTRWDGRAWQTIYRSPGNPQRLAVTSAAVWLADQQAVVRCDAVALTCSEALPLAGAQVVAANRDRVLAVSGQGIGAEWDGRTWQTFRLAEVLPGYVPTDGWKLEAGIDDEGSLWINHDQLWARWWWEETWERMTFGMEPPVIVGLLGMTPGAVWLGWENGLSELDLATGEGLLHDWEEIGADLANNIFSIRTDPDGAVLLATNSGILRGQLDRDDRVWSQQSIPNASVITELAITPDGQVWAQTTNTAQTIVFAITGGILLMFIRFVLPRLIK